MKVSKAVFKQLLKECILELQAEGKLGAGNVSPAAPGGAEFHPPQIREGLGLGAPPTAYTYPGGQPPQQASYSPVTSIPGVPDWQIQNTRQLAQAMTGGGAGANILEQILMDTLVNELPNHRMGEMMRSPISGPMPIPHREILHESPSHVPAMVPQTAPTPPAQADLAATMKLPGADRWAKLAFAPRKGRNIS